MSDIIKINCPVCKKSIDQNISNLKPGKRAKCPYCNTSIAFSGDDIEKKIGEIIKSIKSVFKKQFL